MATLTAFRQFNINDLDFNFYYRNFVQSQLIKDANVAINGIAYPDEFFVDATFGTDAISLEVLGTGFTADSAGAITGGTARVIGELDLETSQFTWIAQSVNVSAATLYEAAKTVTTTDDLAVVEAAFAGNDLMILSPFDDVMNGFAGNDQLAGAGGNDILDGGTGTDSANYLADIEEATITFEGNVLVVTTPTEGTDRLSNFEFVNFKGDLRLVSTLNDLTKPTVTNFSPADGATGVGLASNIVLTFSEAIQRGTGTITLRAFSATGPIVEQFNAATSTRVTAVGSTLTIDPTNTLVQGTKFFVTFDKGSVIDSSGNKFDGTTIYDFTSFGAPIQAQYRLFAPDNFKVSTIGGGQVFGTAGLQDVTVTNFAGAVSFDPSFNRGGDIIRLPGNASTWQIVRSASSAILSDGDTSVTIPIGSAGINLVFGDGTRILKFNDGIGITTIGSQTVTETPTSVTVNPDNPILPIGIDQSVFGRLYLSNTGGSVVEGKFDVFGGNGRNVIGISSGVLRLDPSFNRGTDEILFNAAANQVTAVRQGSSVVFDGPGTDVTVPVGEAGITILFNGGDDRTLLFNAANANVTLDGQVIGFTPVSLTAFA